MTPDELSDARLQCLLLEANRLNAQKQASGKGSKHTPIAPEEASRTAGEVFARGVRIMLKTHSNLLTDFTRTSFLQLMNFVMEESGTGTAMIEKNQKNGAKRGFGYIQITTSGERAKVAKCMKEVSPGSEKDVVLHPERALTVPSTSALASLCYWKIHFIDNPDHRHTANISSEAEGMETVLRLMNSGRPRVMVVDRESHRSSLDAPAETKRRLETFRSLENAHHTCEERTPNKGASSRRIKLASLGD